MSSDQEHSSADRIAQSRRIFAYWHRYRNLLRKRWWIPALTITVALAAQGWRLWSTPRTYSSFGEMVVGYRIATQSSSLANIQEETVGFYGTQIKLMTGNTVTNRAASRVRASRPDLNPPPIGANEQVKLTASVIPKTGVFRLVATGREPVYTRLFLDSLMEEYISLKREMKSDTTEKTANSIRTELVRLEKELRNGDEELIAFQSSNSVQVLQGQSGSANVYLEKWRQELRDLQIQSELLKQLNLEQSLQLEENRSGAGQSVSVDINNPNDTAASLAASGAGYLRLKQIIQLKKAELKERSEYLRPKHPIMVALNDELVREQKLLEIFRQQSTEKLDNTRAELAVKIKTLQYQIGDLDNEVLQIGQKMAQYQRIKDRNQRNQNLYDQYLLAIRNLDLSGKADPETVNISEHACEALPDSLRLPLQLALAIFVGAMLAGGLLFIMDKLDDRPTSFTELQDMFDEAVLGQIPAEKGLGGDLDIKLVSADDSRHAFVEAYRNLRSSLVYMATEGKRAKTILVTSAIPGDGKSLTTSNLAITLAQSGSTVLLIDADLRRGNLHRRLGVDSSVGFTEVLSQGMDWKKTVLPTSTPTLSFLPRGSLCKNPGELFLGPRTSEFLKEVAASYDYVIIDTAPVMAVDDVASLAPHVEGVIFVIRAGQTSGRIAHAALNVLYQREVNILGLVFNSVEADANEYYYYKYKDYSNYPGA